MNTTASPAAETATSRRIEAAHAADPWRGPHGRLGMLLLSCDRATEGELRAMLPQRVAEIHVNRVTMAPTCTVDNLRALGDDLARAAAGLLPGTPLDAVGFPCTSGAVAVGLERVAAAIHETHPGIPVTTPLAAAVRAFEQFGARRIALLTPYLDEVNAIIRQALAAAGLDIVGFDSFQVATDAEMTAIAPASLRDAALALDRPEADALFICCTALRPSTIVDELERRTGKPVITSHQALLWDSLARAGIDTPIAGCGQLLERPERSATVPA